MLSSFSVLSISDAQKAREQKLEEAKLQEMDDSSGDSKIAKKANYRQFKKIGPRDAKPAMIAYPESLRSMNGIVRMMTKKYGSKAILDPILFCEPSREKLGFQTVRTSPQYIKTNHYPGMQYLVRKGPLTTQLNSFRGIFPEEFDFYPESWDLNKPAAVKQFSEVFDPAKTYIMKPSAGHQGDGICLAQKWDVVSEYLKHNSRVIAQEYIARPLLLDGVKFDFRIYVLLESLSPLKIRVFREGLARFCTQKYQVPTSDNLNEDYVHLTNYSLNKRSSDFKEAKPRRKDPSKEEAEEEQLDPKYAREEGAHKRRLTVALRQIAATYGAKADIGARIAAESMAPKPSKAKSKKLKGKKRGKGKRQEDEPSLEPEDEREITRRKKLLEPIEIESPKSDDEKGLKTDYEGNSPSLSPFEKHFWEWVDAVVGKTMLALWQPLWAKYNSFFPPHSTAGFHLPTCPNVKPRMSGREGMGNLDNEEEDAEGDDIDDNPDASDNENNPDEPKEPQRRKRKKHRRKRSSRQAAEFIHHCYCHLHSRCFHLLGFDVMLDDTFRPWLLEVNNNPSMHCKRSELDEIIKVGVFETSLRLMGFLTQKKIREAYRGGFAEDPFLGPSSPSSASSGARLSSPSSASSASGLLSSPSGLLSPSSPRDPAEHPEIPAERRFTTIYPAKLYPEVVNTPLPEGSFVSFQE